MKQKKQLKKSDGGAKDEYLELRLYAAEKQAFKDAADLQGMALSVWVRDRLRVVARKELEEAQRPVAFMDGTS